MRHFREGLLWVGATLGALCLAWTGAMFALGLTPLVFTSGSMSPTIGTGDLAFARTVDASEIVVGDIVSVVNQKDVRITHRVAEIETTADGALLTMQGDANQRPDAEIYSVSSAERVWFNVPKAGYLVNWFSSPIGMFLAGMLVMVVLYFGFRRGDDEAPTTPRVKEESSGYRAKTLVALAIPSLFFIGFSHETESTTAAWSDTGTMTGTVGAAGLPSRPASMSCQGFNGTFLTRDVRLTWPNANHNRAYFVEHSRNSTFTDVGWSHTFAPSTAASHSVEVNIGDPIHSGNRSYFRVRTGYVDSSGNITWLSGDHRAWEIENHFGTNRKTCRTNLTP